MELLELFELFELRELRLVEKAEYPDPFLLLLDLDLEERLVLREVLEENERGRPRGFGVLPRPLLRCFLLSEGSRRRLRSFPLDLRLSRFSFL